MNFNVQVNDYLLAWYLLYGASLSQELEKFKQKLYTKYKNEYNLCYKDKKEIIKYGKNFIPDNDLLYNIIIESPLFKSLKKETQRYKIIIEELWIKNENELSTYAKDVLKIVFPKDINVFIVHPRLQIKEYYKESNSLIFGDEKDKKDMLMSLMLIITRGVISTKFENDLSEEITSTVVELSVLNEIGSRLCGKSCYNLGNNNLLPIKKQLYPYWLMYLGYVDEEAVLKKIFKDNKDFKVNLAFDITKYKVDKNLKKLNISQFLEYCIRNSNTLINIQAYELIDDDVEVI